jgi:hypothetical protein
LCIGNINMPIQRKNRRRAHALAYQNVYGNGNGEADMFTGLHSLWEFDAAAFGVSSSGAVDEITGSWASGGLVWGANNSVGDIAGLLNGGVNLGACDATTASVAYRFTLQGTGAAWDTGAKKNQLFGAGSTGKSFSWFQWIYPTTDPLTGLAGCIGLGNGSTTGWGVRLRGSTNSTDPGKADFLLTNASGNTRLVSGANWVLNAWNLAGVTYNTFTDEVKFLLGVGGATYATTTVTNGPPTDAGSSIIHAMASTASSNPIGCRWDQSGFYDGRDIDLATFDAIYNGGIGRLYANWS